MIFVTVGTHEQPFNRLIKEIDKLAEDKEINDDFYIQTGFSDYIPQNCSWKKFLSFAQMNNMIKKADIIITHGGPASFIAPLELGKIPIVVPREKKFNEHINNHQEEFVKLIDKRLQNIIPVYDIKDLKKKILNYDVLTKQMNNHIKTNNKTFNQKFSDVVSKMFNE